ncbi:MAG: DUF6265 family protein [Chloroflexota bacterium]
MQRQNSSDTNKNEKSLGLNDLRWLLGTWTRHTNRGPSQEIWREADRDVFAGRGLSFTMDGQQIRFSESLLLTKMSEEIFYIAKIDENEFPVSFKLVSGSANNATFENLNHDFPKRLEYVLESTNSLLVTVSGEAGRRFTLQFSKG